MRWSRFSVSKLFLTSALALSAQNLEQFATERLPKGAELAHPVVAGSFGPPGRHIVMLFRSGENVDDSGEFQGIVYLDSQRPQTLPPMGLIRGQFATEVKAVFFENASGGPEPELFILYAYHRNGSTADDSHACLVYKWQDGHFVRVGEVERKVAGLATASAVRQRVRRAIPTLRKPSDYRKK